MTEPSPSGSYADFFHALTERDPYPYQERLGTEPWPDLLDVPTGLGKTAAVVVAWLWKRLQDDPETGRRLVYCLPMRTLVEQTREVAETWCAQAAPHFAAAGRALPSVHVLMGGEADASWDLAPESPAIVVGTQDMLLSRALDRGYGMSRYRWPVGFGLLNDDCLWVLDETQLMGVGVETSAQLQAFRARFGTFGPARTLWMSATLGREQLATVDHPEPIKGWNVRGLLAEDRARPAVEQRLRARKRLIRREELALTAATRKSYARTLAEHVAAAARGGLTLVVLNRVDRAQELFRALRKLRSTDRRSADRRSAHRLALVHSRFRRSDRQAHEAVLHGDGDRIVIATQAVEAGVDVSARTLFTELAPWPSLVQRFGRCNRYGEHPDAEIHLVPIDSQQAELALPYRPEDLAEAEQLAGQLLGSGAEAGPKALAQIAYRPPPVVRPVLRRHDLLELFDTTPDLHGNDLDVSRFIREGKDLDLQVFWRVFDLEHPPSTLAAPEREELCRVSLAAAGVFHKKTLERAAHLRPWRWEPLARCWEKVRRPAPGDTWLLHAEAGGYDPELGWTGELSAPSPVAVISTGGGEPPAMEDDPETEIRRWVLLGEHLEHVTHKAREITAAVGLGGTVGLGGAAAGTWARAVVEAARWHDVGKAHEQFQLRLGSPETGAGPWAKSDHDLRRRGEGLRRYFRHELASALAWLQSGDDTDPRWRDLVAYLIAAHHGKLRLTLRSLPDEDLPPEPERLHARGVWQGDLLPPVVLPGGETTPALELDLSPLRLGEGSWLERMLALRDDPELGPFRLAVLEALLRAADGRASAAEARQEAGDG